MMLFGMDNVKNFKGISGHVLSRFRLLQAHILPAGKLPEFLDMDHFMKDDSISIEYR